VHGPIVACRRGGPVASCCFGLACFGRFARLGLLRLLHTLLKSCFFGTEGPRTSPAAAQTIVSTLGAPIQIDVEVIEFSGLVQVDRARQGIREDSLGAQGGKQLPTSEVV